MAENSSTQALFDLWKKQVEEGTQAWARMIGQAQAVDIAAWSKLLAQGPAAPDLLAQWKQFLDQWIAAWGKVLEQAMGTEAFAQALGKYLEQWLALQAPVKKAAGEATEATLSALGIPSRSQVMGIARQLVELEDRIERVEERLAALMTRMDDLFSALADYEEAAARRAAGKEAQ